jgi:DNA polymerase-3 subunit epsilon
MDLGEDGSRLAALRADAGPLDLVVIRASDAEREAHARYLEDLDKASKGKCVWRSLPDAEAPTTVN